MFVKQLQGARSSASFSISTTNLLINIASLVSPQEVPVVFHPC